MTTYTVYDNLEGGLNAIDEELDPMLPEAHYQDGSATDATSGVEASGRRVVDSMVINISQGTDVASRRIGHNIRVYRIMIRVTNSIDYNVTPFKVSDSIRWIVVLDRQTNGAVCSFGQVLSVPNVKGFRNLDNARRFTILYDKTEQVAPVFNGASTKWFWDTHIDIECDIPIEYSNSTGTISGIRTNNIAVFAVTRDGAIRYLNFNYRVRYDDL